MKPAVPIGPRAILPALVTRALAPGGLHAVASWLLSPLSAIAPEDEVWVSSMADFDAQAPHPTPVVLVHGFLGNPSHFRPLRRFLVARGFRNFATFAYAPRVDHEELARRLGRVIEAVCEVTGRDEVDVVGHSLGGLVARHLLERGASTRVRRLVTLGAPYLRDSLPECETAIFGAADVIIPPPARRLRGRSATVLGCGHLGLLYRTAALGLVAAVLGEATEEPRTAARALRAA
jgi:pimeloyl-ACP methyl ester carboxylesterase